MITALYIWTAVVLSSGTNSAMPVSDWRWAGEFASAQGCEKGAQRLGLKPKLYRCVETGKKP